VLGLVLFLGLFSGAPATGQPSPESWFQQGMRLYEEEKYRSALPAFQNAVALSPMNSTYHHMLGKCYGRIAEHGNWFTALRYVGRTREQFEKAVELDPGNIQAWRDLEEFHRRAPGFLGGDSDRAAEIRARLKDRPDPGQADEAVPGTGRRER